VDVEIGHVVEIELGEVGLRILEDGASLPELAGAKMGIPVMLNGIRPGKIIKPGTGSDIAEDSPTVDISGLCSPVDVIDQFMVISSEESGDMSMPFTEITPPMEVGLVVFPEAHDGGCLLYNPRGILHVGETDLMQPVLWRIVTCELVKPVPVKDGKVNGVPDLFVQCIKDGKCGTGTVPSSSMIVTTGKLEAKIKEAIRISFRIPVVIGTGKCAKGTGKLMISDAVMVSSVSLETLDGQDACMIPFGTVRCKGGRPVQSLFIDAVVDKDLARPDSPYPEAHGFRCRTSKHGTMGDANGRWSAILGGKDCGSKKNKDWQ
jgi:hypothetical protein